MRRNSCLIAPLIRRRRREEAAWLHSRKQTAEWPSAIELFNCLARSQFLQEFKLIPKISQQI